MTDALPMAIEAIPDGGDPFIQLAKWFGLMVAALLVGAAPIMLYLRKYHADHLHNARDAANAEVYETLRQQIRQHGEQLQQLHEERRILQLETASLRTRVAELEGTELQLHRLKSQLDEMEKVNARLKDKLDRKDALIEQLGAENRQLLSEIMNLKERVHELELRLSKDEDLFCVSCRRSDAASRARATEETCAAQVVSGVRGV